MEFSPGLRFFPSVEPWRTCRLAPVDLPLPSSLDRVVGGALESYMLFGRIYVADSAVCHGYRALSVDECWRRYRWNDGGRCIALVEDPCESTVVESANRSIGRRGGEYACKIERRSNSRSTERDPFRITVEVEDSDDDAALRLFTRAIASVKGNRTVKRSAFKRPEGAWEYSFSPHDLHAVGDSSWEIVFPSSGPAGAPRSVDGFWSAAVYGAWHGRGDHEDRLDAALADAVDCLGPGDAPARALLRLDQVKGDSEFTDSILAADGFHTAICYLDGFDWSGGRGCRLPEELAFRELLDREAPMGSDEISELASTYGLPFLPFFSSKARFHSERLDRRHEQIDRRRDPGRPRAALMACLEDSLDIEERALEGLFRSALDSTLSRRAGEELGDSRPFSAFRGTPWTTELEPLDRSPSEIDGTPFLACVMSEYCRLVALEIRNKRSCAFDYGGLESLAEASLSLGLIGQAAGVVRDYQRGRGSVLAGARGKNIASDIDAAERGSLDIAACLRASSGSAESDFDIADEARRINGAMAYLSRSASLNGSMRLGGLYTGPGLTAEILQRQYARTVHSGVPVALIEDIGPDDPGGSLDAAISLQALRTLQAPEQWRKCKCCGREFKFKRGPKSGTRKPRQDAKFCSDKCRVRYSNASSSNWRRAAADWGEVTGWAVCRCFEEKPASDKQALKRAVDLSLSKFERMESDRVVAVVCRYGLETEPFPQGYGGPYLEERGIDEKRALSVIGDGVLTDAKYDPSKSPLARDLMSLIEESARERGLITR